jgi:hypothetical protein
MSTYAKRKLKYSRNENFNLLHYVEWDRFVTLAGSKSGLRVTLSYLACSVRNKLSYLEDIASESSNLCNREPFGPLIILID